MQHVSLICHYTLHKQSLGGGTCILESPCLSVSFCPPVCLFTKEPSHNFLSPYPIWIIFHTIVVHDQGCVMTLISKVKVTVNTYPKSVSRQQLLTAKLGLDNISHNCCPCPKGMSWPWPKVISPRSRSQCIHVYNENLCLGHNSSLPCWIWIIFTQLHKCMCLNVYDWPAWLGRTRHVLKGQIPPKTTTPGSWITIVWSIVPSQVTRER